MDKNDDQRVGSARQQNEPVPPDTVEMPEPTAWPFITALGAVLLAAGLLTNLAFSVVGAFVFLTGLSGWARELMPGRGQVHERLLPREQWAPPVERAGVGVESAAEHVKGERARLPEWIHPYSAGVKGGIVGGMVMAAVAVGYGLMTGRGVWYPVNLLAAMLLPRFAHTSAQQLEAFSLAGILAGLAIHAVVSVSVGLCLAILWPTLPRWSLLWGGVAAPLLWSGGVYSLMGVLNPTMNVHVDWGWFVASQIGFGLSAGLVIIRTETIPAAWLGRAHSATRRRETPREGQGKP
jgi:hypothetical protein